MRPMLVVALAPEVIQRFRTAEYREKVNADPNLPRIRAALANGMRNVKALQDAGVHIAFGTDSGANPVRIPGWAEHRSCSCSCARGSRRWPRRWRPPGEARTCWG